MHISISNNHRHTKSGCRQVFNDSSQRRQSYHLFFLTASISLLFILFIILDIYAYPDIDYRSTTEQENKAFNESMHSFPEEYFSGINTITLFTVRFGKSFSWEGYYIGDDQIQINADIWKYNPILAHELAHNYCWKINKDLTHESNCFIETNKKLLEISNQHTSNQQTSISQSNDTIKIKEAKPQPVIAKIPKQEQQKEQPTTSTSEKSKLTIFSFLRLISSTLKKYFNL